MTPQQQRAVDLLMQGTRAAEVAAAVGVDRVTVWRWRQMPEVEAEINARRHELWDASIERLRSLVPQALETLASELEGKHRLRAAETLLRVAGFDEARKGGLGIRPLGSTSAAQIARANQASVELEELLRH